MSIEGLDDSTIKGYYSYIGKKIESILNDEIKNIEKQSNNEDLDLIKQYQEDLKTVSNTNIDIKNFPEKNLKNILIIDGLRQQIDYLMTIGKYKIDFKKLKAKINSILSIFWQIQLSIANYKGCSVHGSIGAGFAGFNGNVGVTLNFN